MRFGLGRTLVCEVGDARSTSAPQELVRGVHVPEERRLIAD